MRSRCAGRNQLTAVLVGLAGLSFAAMLTSAPARADEDATEQARQHYAKGKQAFDLGKWDDAIAEFEDAYRLRSDPTFLFNMAQAYRRKGDLQRALDLYKNYLIENPDSPKRNDIERRIRTLEKEMKNQPRPRFRLRLRSRFRLWRRLRQQRLPLPRHRPQSPSSWNLRRHRRLPRQQSSQWSPSRRPLRPFRPLTQHPRATACELRESSGARSAWLPSARPSTSTPALSRFRTRSPVRTRPRPLTIKPARTPKSCSGYSTA